MDNEIYFRPFYGGWVKMKDRGYAKSFARAVFRYLGNMDKEEKVKRINENHIRGTSFTVDELYFPII